MLWLILAFIVFASAYIYYKTWNNMDPAKINPDRFIYDLQEGERIQKAVTDTREKFLIVGAGFSGLAMSGALKRNGIPFDTVEKGDKVGGNWYSGVYNHVHILSSKATTEFKDFPMPKDYPDFPSGKQMCAYLQSYAVHFGLVDQIQLNTSVEKITPYKEESGPYKDKELWKVILNNGEERIYKGGLICIGHHWSKRIPNYPGQQQFKGTIMHSKDYKESEIFIDKRVLIVGGGNSACDINVEAARHAAETHCCMRRGYWFLPRTVFGVPFVEMMHPWMPQWFQKVILKVSLKLIIGPYERYGLQHPDHDIFDQHPTINTDILNYLKLGKIKPHPDIKKFDGTNTIEFADGTKQDFDIVVFATGYNHSYPMFEEGFIKFEEGVPQFVSGLFQPSYRNLIFMGLPQPRYGAGPLLTLGCEAVAKIIKIQEKLKYPLSKIANLSGKAYLKRNNLKTSLRTDVLQDPYVVTRRAKFVLKFIDYIPTVEKILISLGLLK